MFTIIAIPALQDNYIWVMIHNSSQHCVIVDPGESQQVIAFLTLWGLSPLAILLTHHHDDHTAGTLQLLQHYPTLNVYGPDSEKIGVVSHPLQDNAQLVIADMQLNLQILAIPGHTLDHIAYYGAGVLFCGDTLFTGGCGRVFEGTHQQMVASLSRLCALPDDTLIYCGHEYTATNLAFAATIEPTNTQLQRRIAFTQQLRARGIATVPSVLRLEKQTNPFLRSHEPTVAQGVALFAQKPCKNSLEVFSALRSQKNNFKIS